MVCGSFVMAKAKLLPNAYGLSSLRDQVKNNKPAGVTDAQIDELFTLYW